MQLRSTTLLFFVSEQRCGEQTSNIIIKHCRFRTCEWCIWPWDTSEICVPVWLRVSHVCQILIRRALFLTASIIGYKKNNLSGRKLDVKQNKNFEMNILPNGCVTIYVTKHLKASFFCVESLFHLYNHISCFP
jgi:hypothetical protein